MPSEHDEMLFLFRKKYIFFLLLLLLPPLLLYVIHFPKHCCCFVVSFFHLCHLMHEQNLCVIYNAVSNVERTPNTSNAPEELKICGKYGKDSNCERLAKFSDSQCSCVCVCDILFCSFFYLCFFFIYICV